MKSTARPQPARPPPLPPGGAARRGAPWEGIAIGDAADLLLLHFLRIGGAGMTIGPAREHYAVVIDEDETGAQELPTFVGAGVTARLALLTGLDILAPEERLGHLSLRWQPPAGAEETVEVIAVGRSAGNALSLEVRRLASVRDSALARQNDRVTADGVPLAAPRSSAAYEIHQEIGRGGVAIV